MLACFASIKPGTSTEVTILKQPLFIDNLQADAFSPLEVMSIDLHSKVLCKYTSHLCNERKNEYLLLLLILLM